MEDLNNVPSSGTYGAAINEVNTNFSLIVNAINSLEYATTKSKGIYNNGFTPSSTTLPNSASGDWCMVLGTGNTFPARIWTFNGTTWAQGGTWNPDGINLNDYATTSALNTAVANSLAQATARMGYGEATARNNAYSVSITNYTLPTNGGVVRVKMPTAATGAATLNISSTGVKTIWYNGAEVSSQNTWEAQEIISVFYDGTKYMASNSKGGGGSAEKIKYNNSQSGIDASNVQEALDEIGNEIGVKAVLGTYNGNNYTLSNGFINNNGEAVVPSNNDWGKTDFIPLPSGANCFSFENCVGYYVVSDIVFYSSNNEQSVVAKYGDYYQQQHVVGFWNIPITHIPSEAAYYRLTFVLKIGSSVKDIALQKITFYQDTSIKTTVEKLEDNIGLSYKPYTESKHQSIIGKTSFNYEYLYFGAGSELTITKDTDVPLNIYYCPNSQIWDKNNYQTLGEGITARTFNCSLQQESGCVRVFNNGTLLTNVTLSIVDVITAQEQIEKNRQMISRILSRVGGVDDSFAQILEFREPVTGSLAKMWTSNTLTQASKEKEWLVIMCHGNGILIDTYAIPSTALDYFRANKINVATIQYQDLNNTGIVGAGFNKYAWGNDSQFAHVICLYNYLQSHYNFHKSVVLAGCSMGGLAMGALAYKKPFPIAFCLGIGPVPSLMTFWDNGNESRKSIIRAAYNMPTDGSDDANAATYFQGHDWWNMGMLAIDNVSYKIGFPNVYLYYGNDSVFRDLFGGTAKYNELCQALKNGGIYSKVEQVGANNTTHDTPTIWTQSVTENVWHNELGTPSY